MTEKLHDEHSAAPPPGPSTRASPKNSASTCMNCSHNHASSTNPTMSSCFLASGSPTDAYGLREVDRPPSCAPCASSSSSQPRSISRDGPKTQRTEATATRDTLDLRNRIVEHSVRKPGAALPSRVTAGDLRPSVDSDGPLLRAFSESAFGC